MQSEDWSTVLRHETASYSDVMFHSTTQMVSALFTPPNPSILTILPIPYYFSYSSYPAYPILFLLFFLSFLSLLYLLTETKEFFFINSSYLQFPLSFISFLSLISFPILPIPTILPIPPILLTFSFLLISSMR